MIYSLDTEIIFQKKISLVAYIYIMILIVIVLSLIIISMLFNYKTYCHIQGIVVKEDSNYYIKTSVLLSDVKYLLNNEAIIIDNKNYNYTIVSVDDGLYFDGINTYQSIKIKLSLDKKYQLNNLGLNLKILKDDKKIINYIFPK